MINYFSYSYDPPTGEEPFSAAVEVGPAPWKPENRLVRIGLKGKEVKLDMRPATSLVFLIDVSGSMQPANKLPLVKDSLKLLVDKLNGDDRLAIVTYAGNAGMPLDSVFVNAENKERIVQTIDALAAGGSTNGAGGITMAYDLASRHFIKDGVNRVILCTDGDFNVGVSSEAELVRLIEEKRASGVFLSVLGFGSGNFQEPKMQQLAKHGNGNFAFIDSIAEGKKVLVDQMGGTLVTIAKDVKIQVDFNPGKVGKYRLIGYENRIMAAQDFRDDRKDAGEIGAGHTVTALYEITAPDENAAQPEGPQPAFIEAGKIIPSDLLMNLMIRYKQPDGDAAKELVFPIENKAADGLSADFQFAAAVAGFGMVLRDSPHKGNATFATVLDLAQSGQATAIRAADAGDHQDTNELLEDIVHYTTVASIELAAANLEVLDQLKANDAELAQCVDRNSTSTRRFAEAVERGKLIPELQERIAALEGRVTRGRVILSRSNLTADQLKQRQEFIGMVEKARALAGQ
jgi:Ca-activated chloride channel family protein